MRTDWSVLVTGLLLVVGCASSGGCDDSEIAYDLPQGAAGAQGADARPPSASPSASASSPSPAGTTLTASAGASGRRGADAATAGTGERPSRITIRQAVQEAITNNRVVMQARLAAAVALSNQRIARSSLLPFVGGRYTVTAVNEPPQFAIDPGGPGGSFALVPNVVQNFSAYMDFPILAFGRYWNNYQAARLSRAASGADMDTAESDIAAAVTAAAFDVLATRAGIDVALATEDALHQQVKDSQALFDAGSVTKVAVLEASVEYDAAVRDREKLQSLVPILRMRLNVLLGRPATAPIEVEDERTIRPPIWQVAALAEEAVAQRPELRSSRYIVAAAERSVRAQIGAEIGEIRGRASYDVTDNPILSPKDTLNFLLTFDVPIFTGGARSARIRRARHELEAAEIRLRELEDQIRTEVAEAHRSVVETYKDIAVAKRSVERSKESLRIQREKFKNGRATNREVLDTTALLTNSRIALVNAIYAYKVALRELHRARGADPALSPFYEIDGAADDAAAASAGAGVGAGVGMGAGAEADVAAGKQAGESEE